MPEWAAWMSSRPGTQQYTPAEWLRFWEDSANRYDHPVRETLAYLDERVLLGVFRLAIQAVAQNRRRELRRLRNRH